MEFVDVIAILSVFVGAPWAIFSGIAKVKAAGGEGESLRRSELEALVQDAVAQATEPLQRRIETLEAIATDVDADTRRLYAAVLADALEPDPDPVDPAAVRRRARL